MILNYNLISAILLLALPMRNSASMLHSGEHVALNSMDSNASKLLMAHSVRVDEETDSELPTFMQHSRKHFHRKLEDYEGDVSFLQGFSIKFQGCFHTPGWNEYAVSDKDIKVRTKRYVRFRLCPQDTCSDVATRGCSKGYGDYIVDMNMFLDAYLSERAINSQYRNKWAKRSELRACKSIVKSCGCYNKADDDWFDFDNCLGQCVQGTSSEFCEDFGDKLKPDYDEDAANADNNEEDCPENDDAACQEWLQQQQYEQYQQQQEQYNQDDVTSYEQQNFDDDPDMNATTDEGFIYKYSQCRFYKSVYDGTYGDDKYNSNNVDDYADDKYFEKINYYVGPYCANQGASIYIGMFTERTCTTYADKGGGRNTYFHISGGSNMPYARESLVDYECVQCYQNYGGNGRRFLADNNNYGYSDSKEACANLYYSSGKCETNMSGKTNNKVYNACNYIDGIRIIRTNGIITKIKNNLTANVFLGFFCVSFLLCGSYVGFLKYKIYQHRKDNPVPVFFYDDTPTPEVTIS